MRAVKPTPFDIAFHQVMYNTSNGLHPVFTGRYQRIFTDTYQRKIIHGFTKLQSDIIKKRTLRFVY